MYLKRRLWKTTFENSKKYFILDCKLKKIGCKMQWKPRWTRNDYWGILRWIFTNFPRNQASIFQKRRFLFGAWCGIGRQQRNLSAIKFGHGCFSVRFSNEWNFLALGWYFLCHKHYMINYFRNQFSWSSFV